MNQKDREYLRSLAARQMEISALPEMAEKEKRWYLHNDLKEDVPIITFDIGGPWYKEIGPKCTLEDPILREIEAELLKKIASYEMLYDDRVIPGYFGVPWKVSFKIFDIDLKKTKAAADGINFAGYHIEPAFTELTGVLENLKPSKMYVDREKTMKVFNTANEIFGDILPIKFINNCPMGSLTFRAVDLMSMENMFISMMDEPVLFDQFIGRIADEYIKFFNFQKDEGLLYMNNGNNHIPMGTFGFTHDLEQGGNDIKLSELWCHLNSQETVGIDPNLFNEIVFPHYKKIADMFGLLTYGCCEPADPMFEKSLSRLKNMRKLSISSWADEKKMGEFLKGKKIIYHRKPKANFLCIDKNLDEDAFCEHIKYTIECAKDVQLEFSFRDVLTVQNNPDKPRRAVELTRKMLEKYR